MGCIISKHHQLIECNARTDLNNLQKITTAKPYLESYKGKYVVCDLKDAYDGDTATIVFMDSGKVIAKKCRLYGYNSPEKAPRKKTPEGKTVPEHCRQLEKKKAVEDLHLLESLVSKHDLIAKIIDDKDARGRMLADIYLVERGSIQTDNISVLCTEDRGLKKYMCAQGHALPYFGEGEKKFKDK
jgi:endonuclease YncB( thermonuclease family)